MDISPNVPYNLLTGFRVRARICAKIKTSLIASSLSRAISWISRSVAPFWKGECLGLMPSQICSEKLEWISNADRSKFNGRFGKSTWHNWLVSIVAFVRRELGNFCETRKLQADQTHMTQLKPSRWHTGYNPSVSSCGPLYETQHWYLSFKGANV